MCSLGPRPLTLTVTKPDKHGCQQVWSDGLHLVFVFPFLVALGAGPCGVTAMKLDNQLISGELALCLCREQIQYLCKSC